MFATTAVVGSYGAAYRLGRFFELLMTSMTFVILPAFSYTLTNESISKRIASIYNNSIFYAFAFLLPILAYAVATTKPLTRLLFGSAYIGAPFYFAFISVGTVIGLIGSFAGQLIIGNGDTRRFMKYQLVVVLAEVILLAILVPYEKVAGALIAVFAVGPILMDALYIKALNSQFSIRMEWKRLGRLVLSALMLFAVLFAVTMAMNYSRIAVLANIAIALLLYPPMLAVTGAIEKRNLDFIGESMSKIRQLRRPASLAIRYIGFFVG